MTPYWLIKLLLIGSFLLVTVALMRPIRSSRGLALRRLGVLAMLMASVYVVAVPSTLTKLAQLLGVEKGINLLVYALVVGFFSLIASSYRREVAQQRRIEELGRAFALHFPLFPSEEDPRSRKNPSTPDLSS
ncbi:DUF2304 domain-containing protein [Schaalia sp. Marseille-Q2122]|uniref:DUF2304 domain-containing protein n=1 Tax=Schaalia sp. Marseille-Q2122 TaxID=2736604 RepID=UPI001589565E|nr:DUF2304 domain-containing protein [Schaalia sp. Marseille-Q2122]